MSVSRSINALEQHLTRNGTWIVKFHFRISKEEQRKRFLERLDEPDKRWKFSTDDIKSAALWDDYMDAYEDMIRATSTRRRRGMWFRPTTNGSPACWSPPSWSRSLRGSIWNTPRWEDRCSRSCATSGVRSRRKAKAARPNRRKGHCSAAARPCALGPIRASGSFSCAPGSSP